MSRKIYPVILSGGSGTRLWPLSRDLYPKQLLALTGPESLLAATVRRVSGDGFAGPVIVCNADHQFLVQDQLAAIGITPAAIIVEPVARNTAPAIAAAAALLRERDPDAVMLVLPSDHIIRDLPALTAAIGAAARAADSGCLVAFGITPTAPETGYGYIRSGEPLGGIDNAYRIARFVEKPDPATAAGYLAQGDWSWNSGMFVFPAGLMLAELARFEPELTAGAMRSVEAAVRAGEVVALDAAAFAGIASKSIDYALMERSEISAIVPASLGWSDVGSWSALWEIGDKDETGNVLVGDVMAEDSDGSYLRSHGPLIAALGLKDVIVIATGDVVLAAAKDRAQDVKRFVGRLRDAGRSEHVSHPVVNRSPRERMILITGGCGFIGSYLQAELVRRGHRTAIADWLGSDGKWRNIAGHPPACIIAPEALDGFLASGPDIEMIYHLGAISETTATDGDLVWRTNVALSQRLWDWCAAHKVRLVYASSAATYGDGAQGFDDDPARLTRLAPLNLYGWSKHVFDLDVAKRIAGAAPLPPQWVGLKFFNVYGPNEYHKGKMISVVKVKHDEVAADGPARLFRSDRPGLADGAQARDFIWVGDVVEVMLWLLDTPDVNGLFNLGTGTARSYRDLANAVCDAAGVERRIEFIDMPTALRGQYQSFTQASMDRLRAAGYAGQFTTLEDGIRRYVQDYLTAENRYR